MKTSQFLNVSSKLGNNLARLQDYSREIIIGCKEEGLMCLLYIEVLAPSIPLTLSTMLSSFELILV